MKADVASALDIVLTAQGMQASVGTADLTAHQGQGGQACKHSPQASKFTAIAGWLKSDDGASPEEKRLPFTPPCP